MKGIGTQPFIVDGDAGFYLLPMLVLSNVLDNFSLWRFLEEFNVLVGWYN